MKITQEQLSFPGSLRNTTTMDGGSVDMTGAYIYPSIHGYNRTAFTYMDVGYEDNAGAVIFPWLLAEYHPSMDIKMKKVNFQRKLPLMKIECLWNNPVASSALVVTWNNSCIL